MTSKSLREQLAEQWGKIKPEPTQEPGAAGEKRVPVLRQEPASRADFVAVFFDSLTGIKDDDVDAAVDRLSQQGMTLTVVGSDVRRLMPHLRRWCSRALMNSSTRKKDLQRLAVFGRCGVAASLLIETVAECDARIPVDDTEREDIRRFVDALAWRSEYRKHRDRSIQRQKERMLAAEAELRRQLRAPLLQLSERLLGTSRQVEFLNEGLSDEDEALCFLWSNAGYGGPAKIHSLPEFIGDYDAMRLYSARMAEHVAIRYYRQLGSLVEDVSIHQVTGTSGRWKTHDIEADGVSIDVKNARRSFSSPGNYSEHCVANWKYQDRTGSSVRIAGVLSDYVTAASFLAGSSSSAIFLGEISLENLERTTRWFETRTGGVLQFLGIAKPRYFPGWVFEYPAKHYGQVDLDEGVISDAIERAISAGIAPGDVPKSLIIFATSKTCIEQSESEVSLVRSLIEMKHAVGLSRMSANLFVLSEFVLAIHDEHRIFDAELLSSYMFFENRDGKRNSQRPFGKLDTESFVDGMLSALDIAWKSSREDLKEFSRFQLVGANVLKGDRGDGRWTTILAYCGGFLVGRIRARCGKSPLIIGEAAVCHRCLHLVCPACGWCTEGCPQVTENPLRRVEATDRDPRAI